MIFVGAISASTLGAASWNVESWVDALFTVSPVVLTLSTVQAAHLTLVIVILVLSEFLNINTIPALSISHVCGNNTVRAIISTFTFNCGYATVRASAIIIIKLETRICADFATAPVIFT